MFVPHLRTTNSANCTVFYLLYASGLSQWKFVRLKLRKLLQFLSVSEALSDYVSQTAVVRNFKMFSFLHTMIVCWCRASAGERDEFLVLRVGLEPRLPEAGRHRGGLGELPGDRRPRSRRLQILKGWYKQCESVTVCN